MSSRFVYQWYIALTDSIDYGPGDLHAIGCDEKGNPRFRREDGSIVSLKLSKAGQFDRHAHNETITVLRKLRYHRFISRAELDAGERFFEDFYASGQSPRVGMNLEGVAGGSEDRSEAQERAYNAWRKACKAMGNCADSVSDVILYEKQPTSMDKFMLGIKKLKFFYFRA